MIKSAAMPVRWFGDRNDCTTSVCWLLDYEVLPASEEMQIGFTMVRTLFGGFPGGVGRLCSTAP